MRQRRRRWQLLLRRCGWLPLSRQWLLLLHQAGQAEVLS
jgi:hypothetical protein